MALRIPLFLAIVLPVSVALAATPEITRDTGTPQAVGKAHTLRTIPEACARISGQFTGIPDKPYTMQVSKTSPRCVARAELVSADKVKPESDPRFVLNDLVKVPNAACPSQLATLSVWRLKVNNAPYKLDAQGRARVYLQEKAQKAWTANDPKRTRPAYAVAVDVIGSCG